MHIPTFTLIHVSEVIVTLEVELIQHSFVIIHKMEGWESWWNSDRAIQSWWSFRYFYVIVKILYYIIIRIKTRHYIKHIDIQYHE